MVNYLEAGIENCLRCLRKRMKYLCGYTNLDEKKLNVYWLRLQNYFLFKL